MSLLSRFPKSDSIWNYSNPRVVQRRARLLYGRKATVFRSNLKTKKYFIIDDDGKKVHFGFMGMEDYTHTHDERKRDSYLKRSAGIRGQWKENPFSKNNLSRSLLWNA
jgi:hypothetical protein